MMITQKTLTKKNLTISQGLDQFIQLILKDQTLQEKLQSAPDQDSLVKLSVQLGAENGCNFTPEEVKEVIERESGEQKIVYPIADIFEPTVANY
ncbi:Nif11-like leader peptide family natural product precursor [Allocoleopsis sp.]|uniref:Nif11-like leader peptide family natural product precursor n=1 Tax=Allocoleopsis sp. TaxID=3088169 RepID=UPI002FCEA35A